MKKNVLFFLMLSNLCVAQEQSIEKKQYLVRLSEDKVQTVVADGQLTLPHYTQEKNAHLIMRIECVPSEKGIIGSIWSRMRGTNQDAQTLPGGHFKTITEYFWANEAPQEGILVDSVLEPPTDGYSVTKQTKLAIQWAIAQKKDDSKVSSLTDEIAKHYHSQSIHAEITLFSPPAFWEAFCNNSNQVKQNLIKAQEIADRLFVFV